MKIAIIVAYFGHLPHYFELFAQSCEINSDYTWLIFTDDSDAYNIPDNVNLIQMNFEQCKELIQSKFDFPITLNKPQKLCDYKCAYGYIFSEYIKEYDWWGHCDLDQIFGNLNHFVTNDMLNKYDKIYSLGHLTLYRNTYKNNTMFMSKLNGKHRYREVFSSDIGLGFDEWLPDNINEIYIQSGNSIMLNNDGADVNPYKTVFTLVHYDIEKRRYENDHINNSIFKWENSCIYQMYMLNGEIHEKEFPYVHLQKRKMMNQLKSNNAFYIIPNKFVDINNDSMKLLKSTNKWKLLNYQFIKVKWNSLKYRIKNNDWNFSDVFKI
ncbi:MAG: hypothetical protein LUG12_11825 [Erysipelotrichaceae bacterium]|nr:hypothetical protein [Erysipelotrichaceae bacterium]